MNAPPPDARLISPGDYGQIRAFVAVADALSFTRASERLGVTPQALSQTIRALETRVGATLFNRTTRSVALTEAGEDFRREVEPGVTQLGSALERARSRSGRPAGTVRLHSFRIAAELYLRPALLRLARDCPEVVVDVTLDDHVVDLVAQGYDAALRIGETVERGMTSVKLGADLRQVAVASPAYLAQHGAPEHPNELARHRCIGWRWPGREQPYRWEFRSEARWLEVAVKGPLIVNSREFAVSAAVDGVGIAFAIEEAVAVHIRAGRLVPLLQAWSAPFPGFALCHPAQSGLSPARDALIAAVVTAASASTDQD